MAISKDAADLLRALHGDAAGWAYYWLKGVDTGAKRTIWFPASSAPPELPSGKYDVYFGVNLTRTRRRPNQRATNETVGTVVALYADMDKSYSLDDLLTHFMEREVPRPSAVAETGGGFHCYWLLSEPLVITDSNRDEVRSVQKAWVYHVDGDPGAVGIARVLRLPGTVNYKPGRNGATVQLVDLDADRRFAYTDLRAIVADWPTAQDKPPKTDPTSSTAVPSCRLQPTGLSDAKIIELLHHNERYTALWAGNIQHYNGKSHSHADLALFGRLLFYSGDVAQADRLFRQSGLYRPKWERKSYREPTILRAIDGCDRTYDPHWRGRSTPNPELAANLRAGVQYAMSDRFTETMRATGVVRVEPVRQTYKTLLNLAQQEGSLTLSPGIPTLAREAGLSQSATHRWLEKLAEARLVVLNADRKKGNFLVIKLIVGNWETDSHASPCGESFPVTNDYQFYDDHLADDAFAVAHWTHTQRRINAGLAVEAAFGPAARIVVDHLVHGAATRKAIAQATGASPSGIAEATRKLEAAGLIVVTGTTGRTGRTKVYALVGDITAIEAKLDDLRPHMKTAGMAQVREYRAQSQRAAWIDQEMRRTTHPNTPEREALEAKRDQADTKAVAILDELLAVGIDPRKSTRPAVDADNVSNVPKPKALQIDPAAEWEHKYQAIWLRWCELDDLPKHQRWAVMMGGDGYDQEDIHQTLTYWVPKMVKPQADYATVSWSM